MTDNLLRLMTGVDVPIPELQLVLHQPRLKEIAFMSEGNFFSALQYLSLDKHQVTQGDLGDLTNFDILMKVLEQSKDKKEKCSNLSTLLLILFPSYEQCFFTPQSIILKGEENKILDATNFDQLQQVTNEVLCVSNLLQGSNVTYNPKSRKAREIAEKMYEGRRKVAEAKAKEGKSTSSILTRYISILSIGQGWTANELADFTLFQLFDNIERYNLKLEWDIDLKVRLTGTKPEKQVQNWMDDIHSS